ncbi:FadD3 family acyl-CoA ligase [Rhodococcus globerulus]|uniref:FadD3 family acyl-CoA ligase n=1 Tax=Rhodococcus globerulus TaxID=33008 RepID=UPI00301B44F4
MEEQTLHPRTIPALLDQAAARFSDVEALVDGKLRLSFQDLRERAIRVSAALMAEGVVSGNRVAIWAPNSARWVAAALGVIGAGGVLVPVNTRYKGNEARDIIGRSEARVVFTEDDFLGNGYVTMLRGVHGDEDESDTLSGAPWAAVGLPAVRSVVSFDLAAASEDCTAWDDFLARGLAISDAEVEARWSAVSESDPADVLFTSGSTGKPKGAMATHVQNVRTYDAWCERIGLRSGDRYLIVNPLFHTFGYKAGLLACLLRGSTAVLQETFEVSETMGLIEQERITVLPGPPTIYTAILDSHDHRRFDLSTLRLAVTGAQSVPVALVRRIRTELFPEVLTAYGLTEAAGTVTVSALGDSDEKVALTSGRPLDGVEVRIGDVHGQPLELGKDGEVLVRGYNVMSGYLDDSAGTAESIKDGWLHTGDVGRLDEHGYLSITGRIKDMFTIGGFNVYPAEVEAALAQHPAISQVAVIGVPDHRMGEVGHAFVVTRDRAPLNFEELITFSRNRLANFKVPRGVTFLTELPVNAAGKVDKLRLGSDHRPDPG